MNLPSPLICHKKKWETHENYSVAGDTCLVRQTAFSYFKTLCVCLHLFPCLSPSLLSKQHSTRTTTKSVSFSWPVLHQTSTNVHTLSLHNDMTCPLIRTWNTQVKFGVTFQLWNSITQTMAQSGDIHIFFSIHFTLWPHYFPVNLHYHTDAVSRGC